MKEMVSELSTEIKEVFQYVEIKRECIPDKKDNSQGDSRGRKRQDDMGNREII